MLLLQTMDPVVTCVSPRVDINFIPVRNTDRFVLKIEVESVLQLQGRPLYSTSNQVFIRNDHGIVNMTPSMIVNWTRHRSSRYYNKIVSNKHSNLKRTKMFVGLVCFLMGCITPYLYSKRKFLVSNVRLWVIMFF